MATVHNFRGMWSETWFVVKLLSFSVQVYYHVHSSFGVLFVVVVVVDLLMPSTRKVSS